jgi:uncharacterized membrane protein YidH (DUF202 family)
MSSTMTTVDPKVFFANERTFLKWLHTSVTLGSVATGLLGVSSAYGGGNSAIRIVGLFLLAMSIIFCLHALFSYHARARLLNMRRSDGFDENTAPMILAMVVVLALSAVYISALMKRGG